jgi:hypothetical protein
MPKDTEETEDLSGRPPIEDSNHSIVAVAFRIGSCFGEARNRPHILFNTGTQSMQHVRHTPPTTTPQRYRNIAISYKSTFDCELLVASSEQLEKGSKSPKREESKASKPENTSQSRPSANPF